MQKGRLIVISGPSGVGKGTVVRALMEQDPKVRVSVSATTRPIRPGEVHGVHYYFISHEEFDRMAAENKFLEHATYVSNSYGTPEEPVDRMLAEGYDVILEIEVQGGLQVMARRPDAISVFIAAPSFEVLAGRLRGRGDTAEELVLQRLETARREYRTAAQYQYIVVNDRLEDAVRDIAAILRADALRAYHQMDYLKEAE